ncbi:MAG: MBL fold metallo-hydrolase [Candidatus Thorarchaeota archaeon]
MSISKVGPNLYEINLKIKTEKFTSLLSSWVYNDDNFCFIVDPGANSGIPSLRKALGTLGITSTDLDYVLLTHIHIDHAGGVGELIKYFPQAQIICHPLGIKHLINPDKLWKGSLKVLGDVAKSYGKITPVPEDRIKYKESVAKDKIEVIETLGHAPHHQSYIYERYLFAGEVAGVNIPLLEGEFTRPATPPIFNYEISMASIQNLLVKNLSEYKICYGHIGIRENAELYLKIAKEQINIWVKVIEELFGNRQDPDFFNLVIEELKKKDKYFSNFDERDKNTGEKEFFFIGNSIKGIEGYIQRKRMTMR